MKVALAQINLPVGDFSGNCAKILDYYTRANADLLLTPELSVSGYSPEDLILNKSFVDAAQKATQELAGKITRGGAIVGSPWRDGDQVFNAMVLIADGKVQEVQYKYELPNFGVFDEPRIYAGGPLPKPIMFQGVPLGMLICRDLWYDRTCSVLTKAGAKILLAPNASPYDIEKDVSRKGQARERVSESGIPMVYLNMVGGQDDVIYDGASFIIAKDGKIIGQAPKFVEHLGHFDFDPKTGAITTDLPAANIDTDDEAELYQAMCLATRDYVHKNGFKKAVLGLSGGIDSALVAAIAADAIGPENVRTLFLPSPHSSLESFQDAGNIADFLGIDMHRVEITNPMQSVQQSLEGIINPSGLTLENIQPRLRGVILMAMSNHTDALLLTTGNKSEIATGYATLYGDMCGAFNPIKDLYKTQIYAVAKWRNSADAEKYGYAKWPVMPERVLTKAPTAELRPGQKDQDTLPPYDLLDKILYKLIEQNQGIAEIVAHGYDSATVLQIAQMLDKSEYKRRQAAPGPKLSIKAFGKDRRMPITQSWKRA
ncbi:MAG: NAD+ synthase [Alphaproteobacteria bacterium]|nr:MAG: NAD+ synthase [Alphaproteobacteria bacterium]